MFDFDTDDNFNNLNDNNSYNSTNYSSKIITVFLILIALTLCIMIFKSAYQVFYGKNSKYIIIRDSNGDFEALATAKDLLTYQDDTPVNLSVITDNNNKDHEHIYNSSINNYNNSTFSNEEDNKIIDAAKFLKQALKSPSWHELSSHVYDSENTIKIMDDYYTNYYHYTPLPLLDIVDQDLKYIDKRELYIFHVKSNSQQFEAVVEKSKDSYYLHWDSMASIPYYQWYKFTTNKPLSSQELRAYISLNSIKKSEFITKFFKNIVVLNIYFKNKADSLPLIIHKDNKDLDRIMDRIQYTNYSKYTLRAHWVNHDGLNLIVLDNIINDGWLKK